MEKTPLHIFYSGIKKLIDITIEKPPVFKKARGFLFTFDVFKTSDI